MSRFSPLAEEKGKQCDCFESVRDDCRARELGGVTEDEFYFQKKLDFFPLITFFLFPHFKSLYKDPQGEIPDPFLLTRHSLYRAVPSRGEPVHAGELLRGPAYVGSRKELITSSFVSRKTR